MSLTNAQARDEMTAMAVDALPVDTYIAYDDLPGSVPTEMVDWIRVTIRHNTGGQATLVDQSAKKRFRRVGVLTAQVFSPSGKGLSTADQYVKMILDAFEGKSSSGGVWFRNCRFQEIGISGEFFQTNVLIDFEYDEMK